MFFLKDGKMTYVFYGFEYVFFGWENDLCFFYGFEYVLFMVLKTTFDFNRFW